MYERILARYRGRGGVLGWLVLELDVRWLRREMRRARRRRGRD
jgi:hypothetical protein